MPEGYIGYQQAEELLKHYPVLSAIVNSLHVELQAAYVEESDDNEGDVIYALVVGNRKLDGMPKPPYSISDKTCNVAFIYKQAAMNTANARVRRLSKEILQISTVLEKLDIAINSLDKDQRDAVDRHYRSDSFVLPSPDLREERRMRKDKRNALDSIARVIRLTEEMFYDVMEKIR